MPARTYQDLLKNPYDEQLFDYYFTSQLVRIKRGHCVRDRKTGNLRQYAFIIPG